MKDEKNRGTILRVPYVSVWDGGIEVETECDVDIKTGEVRNIGCSIIGGLDICEREFVVMNGEQVDVYENDHGFERWADIEGIYSDAPHDGIINVWSAVGKIQVGDMVLSGPNCGYSYLVGCVTDIALRGTDEHDTDNETDDIYVNFTVREYSPGRIAEIEREQSELYCEPKFFLECAIDDVIMAPDMLIRITGLSDDKMSELLESEEKAAAYWNTAVNE